MEDLVVGRKPGGGFKYGNVGLSDSYQSLRDLIDSLPSVPGLMIVLAGQHEFLERPRGIKSYDALWLRIQHEVISPAFNRFAQVVDLDKAVPLGLTATDVLSLHEQLIAIEMPSHVPDESAVHDILSAAAGDGNFRRLLVMMTSPDNGKG